MDCHEALRTRRTVHRYREEAVPREVVHEALELAILAPNHRLTNPWRFLLLGRESRAALADLAVALKTRPGDQLAPDIEARVRGKILRPAWGLLVGCIRSEEGHRMQEDRLAVACAIQNLGLALHARGLGTKWSTGAFTTHPQTYAHLGIEPQEIEIQGMVWIGHPEAVPPQPERTPLEDVLRERP